MKKLKYSWICQTKITCTHIKGDMRTAQCTSLKPILSQLVSIQVVRLTSVYRESLGFLLQIKAIQVLRFH